MSLVLGKPGPCEVIKLFSISAQLSMKFILLINVKMPTIVGILTFISRINEALLIKTWKFHWFWLFQNIWAFKFHAQLSWAWKKFYNLGPDFHICKNRGATVMTLCFWTDRSGQTVQTQIRLLLEEQSDQGLHCLLFHLHHLEVLDLGRTS